MNVKYKHKTKNVAEQNVDDSFVTASFGEASLICTKGQEKVQINSQQEEVFDVRENMAGRGRGWSNRRRMSSICYPSLRGQIRLSPIVTYYLQNMRLAGQMV